MTCSSCDSEKVRRSSRRGLLEYLMSLFGVYPFRCISCGERFEGYTPFARWKKVHIEQE